MWSEVPLGCLVFTGAPLKQEVKVVFVSAESYKITASLQEILDHLSLSLYHTKYTTRRKENH